MLVSYHVHSKWSDGESEIADIIRTGREIGLDEIGISDHYVLTSGSRQLDWSIPLDGIDEYIAAVQSAQESTEDLVVRLGVEADYIPETADDLKGILAFRPFDYVIGSVHLVDGFTVDSDAGDWEALRQTERDEVIRTYWIRIRQMAESGLFDIVGHIDLTKKFAIYPSIDISGEISSALDAIARSGMMVELNTAGWYLPCREQYPGLSIIRGCLGRGIPMLITSDAHVSQDLHRGYDRAHHLLHGIGYTPIDTNAIRRHSRPRLT